MKKILLLLLCLSCVLGVRSQEIQKVVNVEPQLPDVLDMLKMMDITLFRFDLTSLLDEKYTMSIYIDEYEDNKKIKRSQSIHLGDNVKALEDRPVKNLDKRLVKEQMPEEKNKSNCIKELSVGVKELNDTSSMFAIMVPGGIKVVRRVKLHRIAEFKRNFYRTRPFILREMGKDEHLEIPLILYGSGWYDAEYNIIRFCGEKKIDPEMTVQILTKLPHYYILGLELRKVKKLN